tara:strand:+ start:589 stop:1035 length:447 start_codon:yes stop_codon:yes gene_type:complete
MVRRSTTSENLKLEHIPLADVRVAYEHIESDLHKVREKSYADWIPADVYASLRKAESDLHIGYMKDEYVGFLVTSFTTDSGGEPVLSIWAGYQKSGYNFLEEAMKRMDSIADEFNMTAIEFASSREGWSRLGEKLGYNKVCSLYRKET